MADDIFDKAAKAQPKGDVFDQAVAVAEKEPPSFVGSARTMRAAPKPFTKEWFKAKLIGGEESFTEALPGAGATAGGTVGGIAGSSVGPLGTVGGAVSGAGIGGMGGEAAKQLLKRLFGFESPKTSEEAASAIGTEGLLQGGIQLVTEGLPFAAGPLKRAATTQYERALAPTTKINKALTKDIVPGLMERGERGSLEALETRAAGEAKALRPKLSAAYGKVPASATAGSGTTIFQDLEALKGKYVVKGQVANPTAVQAIEGVQEVVKQFGADIEPTSLRQLKHIFDEPVAARGGYAGGDLTTAYTLKAQKAAGNSIRKIMHQASPDVAALD